MKTILIILTVLCAATALGQSASVLPSVVQPIQMTDHPQHASQHDMAKPQDIFEHSDYAYEKGEIPLAELGLHPSFSAPLGDIARAYRKEHASAKKADFVFEKYVASK